MPELSIIIPNYNNAQYLDDCINSIIRQTYQDFEIIISDDCSTDNSVEVINKWVDTDSRIRLIRQTKNIGVSRNRHIAILASLGKYITTLDSDDVYIDPEKLEKEMQLVFFHKKETGIDVCAFSNVVIVDDTLNTVGYQWQEDKIKEGDIFNDIITRRSMIPRDFVFLKSDYFRIGGYDPRFNLYEDWDLKIRLAKIRNFYFTGIKGIGYRRRGAGLSYVPLSKHMVALKKIFKKNLSLIADEDFSGIKSEFIEHLRSIKSKVIFNLEKKRKNYKKDDKLLNTILQSIKIGYYRITL